VSNFYAWVHSIVFAKKKALEAEILEQKYSKVDILVSRAVSENQKITTSNKDEYEQVDNPLIHAGPSLSTGSGCGYVPESVQGLDRAICNLFSTQVRGKDGNHRSRRFAEVALVLNMSEVAVRKRFERLQERIKAEEMKKKSDAWQKTQEALREQRGDGFKRNYEAFKSRQQSGGADQKGRP
jgi:hypothetical protein